MPGMGTLSWIQADCGQLPDFLHGLSGPRSEQAGVGNTDECQDDLTRGFSSRRDGSTHEANYRLSWLGGRGTKVGKVGKARCLGPQQFGDPRVRDVEGNMRARSSTELGSVSQPFSAGQPGELPPWQLSQLGWPGSWGGGRCIPAPVVGGTSSKGVGGLSVRPRCSLGKKVGQCPDSPFMGRVGASCLPAGTSLFFWLKDHGVDGKVMDKCGCAGGGSFMGGLCTVPSPLGFPSTPLLSSKTALCLRPQACD